MNRRFGVIAIALTAMIGTQPAAARSVQFSLPNGLQVVVLPDVRTQAVTHLLGYRVGSAEDPGGKSGLAHLVEHLMFKDTATRKAGEFSTFVASMGGLENATTARDATIYYQRVAKEQLPVVMAYEADRMANLVIKPDEAAAERNILLAERRARIDSSPLNMLTEKVEAALYAPSPYRTPPVGLAEEIALLTGDDARQFYERHYRPNNAFLIVAGAVTIDEVRSLALATYGAIEQKPRSQRAAMPVKTAERTTQTIALTDARISSRMLYRAFQAPSAALASAGTAESFELLMVILAHGDASRLNRQIVDSRRLATSVDGAYHGLARDVGQAAILVKGPASMAVGEVQSAIDDVLHAIARDGVAQMEIDQARNLLKAKRSFEWHSQLSRARAYADALLAGIDAAAFEAWPQRLDRVTVSDLKSAAALLLSSAQVTGVLSPELSATTRQSDTLCAAGTAC